MSPFDKGKFSIFDRVKAFTVEGLANAHVSAKNAASARSANQPIPWKTGSQGVQGAAVLDEELFGKYMPTDRSDVPLDTGLRLLAPVGWNTSRKAWRTAWR